MRLRRRLTKVRHAAFFFEVVEWYEQLRSVTSAWLGAVRRSVQIRLWASGRNSEKMFGVLSSPRDWLLSIESIHQRRFRVCICVCFRVCLHQLRCQETQ